MQIIITLIYILQVCSRQTSGGENSQQLQDSTKVSDENELNEGDEIQTSTANLLFDYPSEESVASETADKSENLKKISPKIIKPQTKSQRDIVKKAHDQGKVREKVAEPTTKVTNQPSLPTTPITAPRTSSRQKVFETKVVARGRKVETKRSSGKKLSPTISMHDSINTPAVASLRKKLLSANSKTKKGQSHQLASPSSQTSGLISSSVTKTQTKPMRKYDKLINNLQKASAESNMEVLAVVPSFKPVSPPKIERVPIKEEILSAISKPEKSKNCPPVRTFLHKVGSGKEQNTEPFPYLHKVVSGKQKNIPAISYMHEAESGKQPLSSGENSSKSSSRGCVSQQHKKLSGIKLPEAVSQALPSSSPSPWVFSSFPRKFPRSLTTSSEGQIAFSKPYRNNMQEKMRQAKEVRLSSRKYFSFIYEVNDQFSESYFSLC